MILRYTHVIWDFNGTILNDVAVGVESINEMLAARGLPVIGSVEEYRELFDFPVKEYYRRLGFDFEREDYTTVLAPEWVALYLKKSQTAPLYAGVKGLAAALRAAGLSQSVLSASEREMMIAQLAARGALGWFDEIWGTDTILAHGKHDLAHAWRKAHPAANAVLLGDTTHDAEIARALGADCILVAEGHQSAARLAACGVPVVPTLAAVAPLVLGN